MLDIESYVDETQESEEQRVARSAVELSASLAAGKLHTGVLDGTGYIPVLAAGRLPRPQLSTMLKSGDVVTALCGYGDWSHAVEIGEKCTLADALSAWDEGHEAAAEKRGEDARYFVLESVHARPGRKRGRTIYTLSLGT